MPLSKARDYLSIGEVLDSLRREFPDVSISKIRFLESEGLVTPERTSKGYRKFYEEDLTRLRHILTLQRDQFLPLKVIKKRLEGSLDAGSNLHAAERADAGAASRQDTPTQRRPALDWSDVDLSPAELASVSGLGEDELAALQDYGVIESKAHHDGNDLLIAKTARRLFDYGFEPRHLRMYRQASEREAALIVQAVMPLTKKRDPRGREEAEVSRREMVELSQSLREVLLRSILSTQV
ncbi:MAG TPA: MerR family transcriptional regulator [Actinomycetota bacterium]|nr:MerR family transcriptional regulator [Actinomycetota bacterium]